MFAAFTTAAKEETFSAFGPWCAETCISAHKSEGEKPHQGVAGKNPALHQGITWSNSTTALGLRGARLETRVRSRCTGKERDSESGLDNFRVRYDASSLGRFMTPDWAEKPTDVPYANFGNPQSLNLYAYVENNPTTLGDPDGHAPWGFGGGSVCSENNDQCQKNQQEAMKEEWEHNVAIMQSIILALKDAGLKATKAEVNFINAYVRKLDSLATWGLVSPPSTNNAAQRAGANTAFVAMLVVPEGDEAEAARLLSGWSKGSLETVEKSILYHFGEHGEEVGAKDVLTYLRKAAGFSTKGAERVFREDGTTIFKKEGRYIIKDTEGLIRSFGLVR